MLHVPLLLPCPAFLQVLMQSLVANRFMATFREPILDWNAKLNAVADVMQLMADIQRSWSCERGGVCGTTAVACLHFCTNPTPASQPVLLLHRAAATPPMPADLESLFIQSDEVRRELPDATQRFAKIDAAVRAVLLEFAATNSAVVSCGDRQERCLRERAGVQHAGRETK